MLVNSFRSRAKKVGHNTRDYHDALGELLPRLLLRAKVNKYIYHQELSSAHSHDETEGHKSPDDFSTAAIKHKTRYAMPTLRRDILSLFEP